MIRLLKPIFILISVLIFVWFIVIVINQTYQVTELAGRIHPSFGTATLIALLILYTVLITAPVYLYFRLPGKLVVPEITDSDEYKKYISQLKARLKSNKYVKQAGLSLSNESELNNALVLLARKSDEDIKKTTSIVFVSTAVSQSGKLDGFIVLILLSKMIWRIAHIYNQRPSPRELLQLYANVAGTALVAMELDEIDIGEQIEPVIDNVIGASIAGAIPGLQHFSSFVFGCIMEGSINAYLTLRIGSITKSYCGSLVKPQRKTLRRAASIEAATHLGKIVNDNAKLVTKKIFSRIKERSAEKFSESKDKVFEKVNIFKKDKK